MKHIAALILAFAVVLVTAASAAAFDYGCDVDTVADAVYLENLETGAVIYTKNADQKMYPASTTKIMTYVVTAENIADLDGTKITIKEGVLDGLDPESTVMGLSEHIGEQISVKDLLYGLMLPSGNDAALVLADYVGGGISGFVDMMNAKAQELGCTGTHFANPHGLHDPDHYTTAEDMAKIAKYARTLPYFAQITSTVYYTPDGFDGALHNTNYMLDSNEYVYYHPCVIGIKTGYTDEAGKCLVSAAASGEYTYLCVALGAEYSYAEDINYAMLDTAALYDWSFENLAVRTVYSSDEIIAEVPVRFVLGDQTVALKPEKDAAALLPADFDKSLVTTKVEHEDSVDAPVHQGDTLGTIKVYYDGAEILSANAVAAADIERNELVYAVHSIGQFISGNIVIIVIAAVLILALIIFLKARSNAKKRERARRRHYRR